jgi:hypothetical protein
MRSIMQHTGLSMQWKQPHLMEPAFELKYSEEVLASLRFKNSFGSYAEGAISEGEWSFKTKGFLSTQVIIRVKGSEKNVALYRNNTWSGGGTLEFPDGRKYQANSNFWHAQFEFTDESGETLIRFTNIEGFKLHAQLELLPAAYKLQETPLLVLLGWYLAVMTSRDGEMVAAIV